MDTPVDIPVCPLPGESPNDVVPMLVVLSVFLLCGWLIRFWKRRREARRKS